METNLIYIGAGLAIGLAGLGVAFGQGMVAKSSIDIMGKNPNLIKFLLTVTILGIALIESAAIYGLVISMQILGAESLSSMQAIGAGLSIGITGFASGICEGMVVAKVMESANRNPEKGNTLLTYMVLFVALIEVIAIYGLIIAMQIIG